jgi:hypothetical protein
MTSSSPPPDPGRAASLESAAPTYGEMAPPGYVSPVAPPATEESPTNFGAPAALQKSRTADVIATIVLLAFGLFGTFLGLSVGLTLHESLQSQSAKYGLTYHDPKDLGAIGAFVAISHVVLFFAALGGSIPLLLTRRLAFWVPLVAGVVAQVILWGTLLTLILSDHALMAAMTAAR